MELKITIDNTNIAGTVEEMFRSLSPEACENIATEIVRKFLAEPANGERLAEEARLIDAYRKDDSELHDSHWSRFKAASASDDRIRGSDEFKSAMSKFVSVREKMVSEITQAAQRSLNANVQTMVQNDPYIQEVKQIVVDEVRKSFPQMAQNAVSQWFVQNLNQIQNTAMEALTNSAVNKSLADSIAEKLSTLSNRY